MSKSPEVQKSPIAIQLSPAGTGRIHTSSVVKVEQFLEDAYGASMRRLDCPVTPYTFETEEVSYIMEIPTTKPTR